MKKLPHPYFYPLKFFILLLLLFTTGLAYSQEAMVLTPKGGFKIDGALRANVTTQFGDWVPRLNTEGFTAGVDSFVLDANGNPEDLVTTRLKRDEFNNNIDNIFTQGSKFNDYISALRWGLGGAPNKNDIHNGMFHASGDASGNQWVFIGGDRLDVSGTSYIDFEFLQGTIAVNGAGTFTGDGLAGGRNIGDINISMEYNNGGTAPKVVIYRWKPTSEAGTAWAWDSTGSAAITQAFAKTNLVNADVPFGAFGGTTYQPFAFVESAINVTQLVSAAGNCAGLTIKTLWIKTKASSSSTAALKDFMDPISLDLTFGGVSITPIGPFCAGASSVTLSGSPSGGTFSGPGVSGTTFSPTDAGVGTHTVVYTATAGVNCTKSTSIQVVVNANPTTTDPTDQIVCNNTSTTTVTFSSAVAGATFAWTNNTTSIGLAASGAGNISAFTATNSGTSNVVATIEVAATANGCTGASQSFTITVKPTPTVTDPPDQSVCNGASTDAVNFTGAVAGTTFAWTNNTTSIGLAANGSGNISAFNAVNSGTSNVVATISVTPTANSCSGSQQSFTITVKPTPTVTDPSDQTVCNGGMTNAVNFTGAVAGTTFAWTNNTPSIGLAANGSGNIAAFAGQNGGVSNVTATITVTPTANGCPGTPQDFTITVNAQPAAPTICLVQPTLCGPATGSITVLSPTGAGYEYSKDGGTTWQTSPTFSDLAAGSDPSIVYKTPLGCVSAPASCGSASICEEGEDQRAPTITQTETTARSLGSATLEVSTVTVKAMPNPFSDKVRFMITSPEAGSGTLDIYNMTGQKIKTVYQGHIPSGVSYFDLTIATRANANFIYVLKIGEKRYTGNLSQLSTN